MRNPKKIANKAISPIFATLIILAVVTVLFIPVFIWATGTSSQTEDFWESLGLVTTERIVIEEVNLKPEQDDCLVYVRNIGKTAVTINDIIIVAPNNIYTYEEPDFVPNDPINGAYLDSTIQGELVELVINNLGFSPSDGYVYTIKVFTSRGVGGEYEIVAK